MPISRSWLEGGRPPSAPVIKPIISAAAVTADYTTDVFTYSVAPATPLADNDTVILGGNTVPTGFSAGKSYYVVAATPTTFQLAATVGGTAVDFTANGTSVTVTGGDTLTLGASGIDMSAATQNLTVSSAVSLPATQPGTLERTARSP